MISSKDTRGFAIVVREGPTPPPPPPAPVHKVGTNGPDTLIGGVSGDHLEGLAGDDTLQGGAGADTLDGGAGSDTASYANATKATKVSLAQPQTNTGEAVGDIYISIENLRGSNYADTLTGNGGDNILEGGPGADALNGGLGIDTASYAHAAAGVTANLQFPVGNTGDALGDTYVSIENITGSAFADVLSGTTTANVLMGGAGGDVLNGGSGTDTASYANAAAGVAAFLGATPFNTGDAAGDVYNSIENLSGSRFGDMLAGDAGHNRIDGGDGNDTLLDSTGSDTLIGGLGDDTLTGGAGPDTLDGGDGSDTVSYFNALTYVQASLMGDPLQAIGDAKGDVFTSIENLSGSDYNDVLTGNNSANILTGGAGDDTLGGGDGIDTFNGGSGVDVASYRLAGEYVKVSLINPATNYSAAVGDVLTGIEGLQGTDYNDSLTGDNGVNILLGWKGNDVIEGLDGDDYLFGEAGDDLLTGGLGADRISGGKGVDTVSYANAIGGMVITLSKPDPADGPLELAPVGNGDGGGDGPLEDLPPPDPDAGHSNGADGMDILLSIENAIGSGFDDLISGQGDVANVLEGRGGYDTLKGAGGDDVLIGGVAGDVLDGGTGIDTASYRDAVLGVTADLSAPALGTGEAMGDSYISIENLEGSAVVDKLTGDAAGNVLSGLGGADKLFGLDGDDTLIGGAGADALNGGLGVDTVSYANASAGVSASFSAPPSNTGDAAGDSYVAVENLSGSAFDDILTGNAATNTLWGEGGADILNGMNNVDILIGGAGGDVLDGGAGIDTASYRTALAGVTASLATPASNTGDALGDSYIVIEYLEGSLFDDTLVGDGLVNKLSGLAGADVLIGGLGKDTLDGGDGSDTASYRYSNVGLTASLLAPASNTGEALGDIYASIENLEGSGFNDILGGDNGANTLFGLAGADQLSGGGGADVLIGGLDGDVLDGGLGVDIASYADALGGVHVSLADPAVGTGDAFGDTFVSIEGLIGSAGIDELTGDDGDNLLIGLAGIDNLSGGGGADILVGGLGGDVLHGGLGADTASYADAAPTQALVGTPDGVRASLTSPVNNLGEAAGDSYVSVENLTGSAFFDQLVGDATLNILSGLAGNDELSGMGGNDILDGGAGKDKLDGGAGIDTASYGSATAGVTANLSSAALNTGDAAGDTYVVVENLTGSAFADTLVGTAAKNVIDGGGGDDILWGLGGGDTFVLHAAFGHDVVKDFTPGTGPGHDVLAFDAAVFASFAAVMANAAQVGTSVVITVDAATSVTLENVTLASLVAADFLFV